MAGPDRVSRTGDATGAEETAAGARTAGKRTLTGSLPVQRKVDPDRGAGAHEGRMAPLRDGVPEDVYDATLAENPPDVDDDVIDSPGIDDLHGIDVDELRPHDRMQQRRALFGAVDAAGVLEAHRRPALIDTDDREPKPYPPAWIEHADRILFKEGSGVVALEKLDAAERAIAGKPDWEWAPRDYRNKQQADGKPKKPKQLAKEAALREQIAAARRDHARRYRPTLDALIHKLLSEGPPKQAQAVPGAPSAEDPDVLASVIPNDGFQQEIALAGASTAQEIFEADPEFQAQMRQVAERHAAIEAKSSTAKARKQAEARAKLEHAGDSPEEQAAAILAAGSAAAAEEMAGTVDERMAEMNEKFRYWGQRWLFERGGAVGNGPKKRLNAAETALVKGSHDPAALKGKILMLRRAAGQEFAPKLALFKARFISLLGERFTFAHEMGKVRPNEWTNPPKGKGLETVLRADQTNGVIAFDDGDGHAPVAESVVLFAMALKARIGGLKIEQYPTHSQGEYSVDMWPPGGTEKETGFWPVDLMIQIYDAVNDTADDLQILWQSIYNDSRVAKVINAKYGKKILFGFEHGPDPFVSHCHLNLTPKKFA